MDGESWGREEEKQPKRGYRRSQDPDNPITVFPGNTGKTGIYKQMGSNSVERPMTRLKRTKAESRLGIMRTYLSSRGLRTPKDTTPIEDSGCSRRYNRAFIAAKQGQAILAFA